MVGWSEYPICGPKGLRFKVVGGIVPTQHADGSFDLHCPRLTVVAPGREITIDTRIEIFFPKDTVGSVMDKPSRGKQFKAEWGDFDNSHRGSIPVVVRNESNLTLEIQSGQVLAQMFASTIQEDEDLIPDLREFMNFRLGYRLLDPEGIAPTPTPLAVDVYCPRLTVVAPRERSFIDTRIGFVLPEGRIGVVSDKQYGEPSDDKMFRVETRPCLGVGPLVVHVRNTSDQTVEIQRGQVIAEMMVIPKEEQPVTKKRRRKRTIPDLRTLTTRLELIP